MGGFISIVSYSRPSLMIIVFIPISCLLTMVSTSIGAFSVITNLRVDLRFKLSAAHFNTLPRFMARLTFQIIKIMREEII